jgi:hypothetical protein
VTDEPAGAVIAALITKELERAQATTASLQARGLAVITSSGTLATLLFGLSALATQAQDFRLSGRVTVPLTAAAVFLVLAAIAGIATNAPRQRHAVGLDGLTRLLDDELWFAQAQKAVQSTARAQLAIAAAARRVNHTMARYLLAGIALEICGVACIAWAVVAILSA